MKDWSGHTKTAKYVIEKKNKRYRQKYNYKIRCTWLGVGDMVLPMRTTLKSKHKIQDHWEDTIYCIKGQPYAGLPVFRITPVAGKVKGVHQNLLLLFGGNIEVSPENEGSWHDVNKSQDCILTVSDDDVPETEVVLTDPKPVGEGDAMCVQCVQTVEKPDYLVKPYGDG